MAGLAKQGEALIAVVVADVAKGTGERVVMDEGQGEGIGEDVRGVAVDVSAGGENADVAEGEGADVGVVVEVGEREFVFPFIFEGWCCRKYLPCFYDFHFHSLLMLAFNSIIRFEALLS